MKKLRIAVGMENDDTLTKEHFGDSKFYWIIDIFEDGSTVIVEKRINTTLDVEEEFDHGDPKKFRAVVNLLRDIDAIVFYAAGPNYLRIKNQSPLVPVHVNTRSLSKALEIVKRSFDSIYKETQEKKKKFGVL